MNQQPCQWHAAARRLAVFSVPLVWLVAWGLLGFHFLQAAARPSLHPLSGTVRHRAVASVPRARPAQPSNAWRTKPIELIRVGERVLGENPLRDPRGPTPEPDERSWRRIALRAPGPSDSRSDIVLLRPAQWVSAMHAAPGCPVDLDLPEMGISGSADVLSIGACPAIARGQGNVVTGTFVHTSHGNLVNVRIDGLPAPICCTSSHAFWSEDRQGFVDAGSLRRGERVSTNAAGAVPVEKVESRSGDELVFNIEVNGSHVYRVSPAGILVHNVCTGDQRAPQIQHAISMKPYRALQEHPNLQGQYTYRDPRFTARASSWNAHNGYQTWHREYDNKLVDWIELNKEAKTTDFEKYLNWLYANDPDLKWRFPGGLVPDPRIRP